MSRKKSHLEEKNLKKIGERFELLRDYLNLKQFKFAKLLGMAPNSYSDIKRGIKGPTMPVLLLVEHRYGISPIQMLTGDGFSLDNIGASPHAGGVAEPQAEYQPTLPTLLKMATAVLKSHTEHATALAYNIQSFYNAVQCTTAVQELQKRVSDLEQLSPGSKPGKKDRLKAGLKP